MEEWKTIEDFPNYMVSSEGRVKNIKYNRLLKPRFNDRGYISFVLYNNGKNHTFRVNRLVAQIFIPNPENKPYIDHINGIRDDNRVCNLRWATHKENMNNPQTKLKLRNNNGQKIATEYAIVKNSKPIVQFSKNGDFIRKWDSASIAEQNGKFNANTIRDCCKGKRKTCGGYKWHYYYKGIWIKNHIPQIKLKKVA